jgi:hypothetical protein
MRSKIVLAVVLCLIAAAALCMGATPTLAAGACTCHTALPPTATAAHAPLVAGVTDCTTCHKGMTVPHQTVVKPNLTLEVWWDPIIPHFASRSWLHIPWVPLAGVMVYVQGLAPDATAYTDLGHFRTGKAGISWGTLPKGSITDGMTFRGISQGVAGPPVVMPALDGPAVDLPTPTLKWRFRGPVDGALRLGRSVTAKAWVTPKNLTGPKPMFEVHQRIAGKWHWLLTVRRPLSVTGTYSWTWTPKHRGMYKMFALIGDTAAYGHMVTSYRSFRVK